jgi:AcrR family transcriptional regulator
MARISKSNREEFMETNRQRLLDAAAMEFAQKGFNGANINDISISAGLAKGTIYNYFESKHALMMALIADAGAKHVQFIREGVQSMEDPSLRLKLFFEYGFRFIEEHPSRARFLITTLYSSESEFQKAMFLAYQPMFWLVNQEILVPGIKQGIFREVDPVDTATLVMTVYLGTSSNVDLEGKVFMDPKKVADFMLHALMRDTNNGKGGV